LATGCGTPVVSIRACSDGPDSVARASEQVGSAVQGWDLPVACRRALRPRSRSELARMLRILRQGHPSKLGSTRAVAVFPRRSELARMLWMLCQEHPSSSDLRGAGICLWPATWLPYFRPTKKKPRRLAGASGRSAAEHRRGVSCRPCISRPAPRVKVPADFAEQANCFGACGDMPKPVAPDGSPRAGPIIAKRGWHGGPPDRRRVLRLAAQI